jgi:nitrogen PTS system EIIA component
MKATVPQAAALLGKTEEEIYDLIESGDLPAHKINDQYRLNRTELLEWATSRKVSVAPEIFNEENIPSVSACLRRGGVHHISGRIRDDVIRGIIKILRVADESDREMLLALFLSRDALGSTSVGEGIAIPHVRNPIVLSNDEPLITLCFIEPSADFESIDGTPIYALFVLICPTIHIHLQMLAKLAYLLRMPKFRELIRARAPEDEIVIAATQLEEQN